MPVTEMDRLTTHGVRAPLARSLAPSVLFWTGFALLAYGFVHFALWRAISRNPSEFLGSIALIWAALACVLAWLGRCSPAAAVLVVGLGALAHFAGVGPSVAVVLIGLAALGVGTIFVPAEWNARASLAMLVGLAVICGVDGWLLPFPIHVRAVYLPVLLAIIFLRRHSIAATLRPAGAAWSGAVDAARWPAALAVLAIGIASTGAWLPTMLFDDLAYHLALPSQLAQLGYYQMNVGSNVWALAPWASDVLQGIAQVVAGSESRGAVDVLWVACSCVLMWELCAELELRPAMRWLAVGLFVALPLTTYLLDSMQTEGPTVAVILALALVITAKPRVSARVLIVMGLLFGLLLGLKVSNLWFAGPLGLWWLWRSRVRWPWRWLPLALLLGLVVAGSSYAYAWALTGNPVLPLFNGFFQSPWFHAVNYHDNRWDTGFHWNIVWNLVFHSNLYMEGGAGDPILVLIGLGGCFLVALTRRRVRGLALVGAAALLLPLYEIQYFRYAYPALALLIPAMLCGVPVARVDRRHAWGMWVVMWLLVGLSLAFASGIGWQLKLGALQTLVESGKSAVIARVAPVRPADAAIRDRYGESARTLVLVPASPFAAEMAGQAFVTSWYDPELSALAVQARDGTNATGWLTLFDRSGANFVMTDQGKVSRNLMHAIETRHGSRVYDKAGVDVWQLPPSRSGHFTAAGAHGWKAVFDTAEAPPVDTLAAAQVEFACTPALARQGHIVVHWHVEDGSNADADRWGWAPCLQNGVATASIHFRAPARVTALEATAQPDPNVDMGMHPIAAHASLLRDLTAERDMAAQVRRMWGPDHARARKIEWFTP